jgi:8-oxo-dGTP diphosphatase
MQLATLCYVRKNGKTLMIYRNKKPNDVHKGKWNGLGGKFNPGEMPEECAVREVLEESGLQVRNPRLHGILTFPQFSGGKDWYVFVYVFDDFAGELIDSDEGRLAWIDDSQLLNLYLWEGDHYFLEWINQKRFFSGKFIYKNGRLEHHEVIFHHLSQLQQYT